MNRREFNQLMIGAVAGAILAGKAAFAAEPSKDDKDGCPGKDGCPSKPAAPKKVTKAPAKNKKVAAAKCNCKACKSGAACPNTTKKAHT